VNLNDAFQWICIFLIIFTLFRQDKVNESIIGFLEATTSLLLQNRDEGE